MVLELDFFGNVVRVTRRKGDRVLETQEFKLTEAGDLWHDRGCGARLGDLLAHFTIALAGVSQIRISGASRGEFSVDGVSVPIKFKPGLEKTNL